MNNIEKVGAMITLAGLVDGISFEILSSPALGGIKVYKFLTSDNYTIAEYNIKKDTDVSNAFKGLLELALNKYVGMGAKIIKDMGEDEAYVFLLNKVKESTIDRIKNDEKFLGNPVLMNAEYNRTFAHINNAYEKIDESSNISTNADTIISNFIKYVYLNLGAGVIDPTEFYADMKENLTDKNYNDFVKLTHWLDEKETPPSTRTNKLRANILTAIMMADEEDINSFYSPVSKADNYPVIKINKKDDKNGVMAFFHERESKYKDAQNLMTMINSLVDDKIQEKDLNNWEALYSENHRDALPIMHDLLKNHVGQINLNSYPYLKASFLNLCYLNNVPIKGISKFNPKEDLKDSKELEKTFDRIYNIANSKEHNSEFENCMQFVSDGKKIGKIFGLDNIFSEPIITGIEDINNQSKIHVATPAEIIEFMQDCGLISKHADMEQIKELYYLDQLHFENPRRYASPHYYIDQYAKHLKSLDGKHIPEVTELLKVQKMPPEKIAKHLKDEILKFANDFDIPLKDVDYQKLGELYIDHLLYICGQKTNSPMNKIIDFGNECTQRLEPKSLNDFLTKLDEEHYEQLFGALYNPDLVQDDDEDKLEDDDEDNEYVIDMSKYKSGIVDYINALADFYSVKVDCDRYDNRVYDTIAGLVFKLKNIIMGADDGDLKMGAVLGLNQEGINTREEQMTYLSMFEDELDYFFDKVRTNEKETNEFEDRKNVVSDYSKNPSIMSEMIISDLIELGNFSGASPNLFKVIEEILDTQENIIRSGKEPLIRQIKNNEYLVLEDVLGLTENCLESRDDELEYLSNLRKELNKVKEVELGSETTTPNTEPIHLDASVKSWNFYLSQMKTEFAKMNKCQEDHPSVISTIKDLVATSILLLQNNKADVINKDIEQLLGLDQLGLDTDLKKIFYLKEMLKSLESEHLPE